MDCSFGFRPGRSAHQALAALWAQMTRTAGGWVLEVDVRKFFDAMDHGHIREILSRRVLDGVQLRLIGKWLNARTPAPPSLGEGTVKLLVSDRPNSFDETTSRFLGGDASSAEQVDL